MHIPKQNSSGGKNVLLGISKRGDTYLSDWASLYNLWAQAKIDGPGIASPYHLARGCVTGSCTLGPIAFADSFVVQAQLDEPYSVALTALGSGNVNVQGATFTISAWVDPRIEIDPAFARRNDFRLVFSAGVTPVPEAGTMSLSLLGLALTAGAVCRRRQVAHLGLLPRAAVH